MLDAFIDWSNKILNEDRFVATLHIGEDCDNRSAFIDFDENNILGRITCWNSGDFYAEVVEIESGKTLYGESGTDLSADLIEDRFKEFFVVMKKGR